eukprot:CAMPEP_0116940116 /NCGR_PEP_ID=MMETSP0467-20121206/33170_1 /TAXON_ID=283647 /ORGANISM="Mesodinium pulex, Strain SPMC105" /LENGTH=136 /DNA_ID=CAMNT_0004622585 /DNA_START=162 /DNA_END=572 /DNA_ORIENTATION=-
MIKNEEPFLTYEHIKIFVTKLIKGNSKQRLELLYSLSLLDSGVLTRQGFTDFIINLLSLVLDKYDMVKENNFLEKYTAYFISICDDMLNEAECHGDIVNFDEFEKVFMAIPMFNELIDKNVEELDVMDDDKSDNSE